VRGGRVGAAGVCVSRSAPAAPVGVASRAGAGLAVGRLAATDRAQPRRGVSLVLGSPFETAVAVPRARHLEADAGAQHYLHEPRAAAGAVLREPPLKVLGEAEVVARVLVGAGEVEQVLGRPRGYADLVLDAGGYRRRAVRRSA
jgi:hypothetical protein